MKRILVLLLVLCLMSSCTSWERKPNNIGIASPFILPDSTPYTGSIEPIIKIHNYYMISKDRYIFSSGTGFIIERNKKRYLVTAYHVLDGVMISEFFTKDNKHLSLELGKIYLIEYLDAIIIELKSCSAKVIPLKMGKYKQDGQITTWGFPNGEKLEKHKGINYGSQIESTAIVKSGMSGGPVIDENGDVIGIISAKSINNGPVKSLFSRLEDIFYKLDHK